MNSLDRLRLLREILEVSPTDPVMWAKRIARYCEVWERPSDRPFELKCDDTHGFYVTECTMRFYVHYPPKFNKAFQVSNSLRKNFQAGNGATQPNWPQRPCSSQRFRVYDLVYGDDGELVPDNLCTPEELEEIRSTSVIMIDAWIREFEQHLEADPCLTNDPLPAYASKGWVENIDEIPPDYRSREVTLKFAAETLGMRGGKATKWLRESVGDKSYTAWKINRQRFVFDLRGFTGAAKEKLSPSAPNSVQNPPK